MRLKLGSLSGIIGGVSPGGSRPSPIGVDFGVSEMKLLQVQTGEPASLIAAASVETPAALLNDPAKRLNFQLGELASTVRKGGFKGKRGACTFPAEQTLCKALSSPKVQGVSLSEVVSHALSEQLECHPDALVCRAFEAPAPGRSGKSEMLGIAAPRELIERLVGGLRHARLEPVGMHSEFLAMVRSFAEMEAKPENGAEEKPHTTLYLDIGLGSTKIAVAIGAHATFARRIDLGGRHIIAEIERQQDCNAAEATRLWRSLSSMNDALPVAMKKAAGAESMGARRLAESAAAGVDLTEPLEILTDEVAMAVRYHESVFPQKRLERIVFVGGESRQVALCQHIAKSVRLTAQIADPMAKVARSGRESTKGVDLAQPQPGWAVALGLCLSPTDL